MMKKAVYPGSFDPLSNGHLDLIKRASKLFDELHVLVSYNTHKKTDFSPEERVDMIIKCIKNIPNVVVRQSSSLVVNYCKDNDINVIVRGLRNFQDYENEFTLFQYNRDINPKIETILLCPTTKTQVVSSSAIKELIEFNVDITPYVPKEIVNDILKKLKP